MRPGREGKVTREKKPEEFVVDAMLGRLARWLRVLGYDAIYRVSNTPGSVAACLGSERRLVTRRAATAARYPDALLLTSTRVGEQLRELLQKADIRPPREMWFSRCLLCNQLLNPAPAERAQANVPEHVYYCNQGRIRWCPSCGRYYWPGTHRARMIRQLRHWGLPADEPTPSPASVQGTRSESEKI